MNETAITSPAGIPERVSSHPATPALWLIARVVWLEALRRKDLWAVLVLMGIYVVAAIALGIVRGDSAVETQFVFNLGMTVSFYLAGILTALLAARQLPEEMEKRTLYPLLAKPVDRSTVILGKFIAILAVGTLILVAFAVFVRAVSHWLPEFQFGMLLQCVVLQIVALALLAALTLCASIWAPAPVSLLLGLLLFFGSGAMIEALKSSVPLACKSIVATLCLYLPNFSLLDLSTRFTDGGSCLTGGEYFGLLVYSIALTGLFLGTAIAGFERKAL